MVARVATLALMAYLLLLASRPANSELRGFRATMIRREPTTMNFTRAAQQTYERLSMLAARLDAAAQGISTETPLRAGGGAYEMELSISTPPQKLMALADTGSNLIWAKCGRCKSCAPQGSPSYEPSKSSTFSKLPCSDRLCVVLESQSQATCSDGGTECDYRYSYGLSDSTDHYTQGYMANETFTLGDDTLPGVGFGCTKSSEGNYGTGSALVGLGRGQLSLVSQLDLSAFSYCLIDDPSMASPLLFGSLASLSGAGVQSTNLLSSSTYYNVKLNSITIGYATTPGTGTNGVIFDSGTTLTYLTEPAYTAAKKAILFQTRLPRAANKDGFEACFQLSDYDYDNSNVLPTMALHFDEAVMNLPAANYFQEVEIGVICWIVQRSSSLSIIGNIMQMNYHIRYDLDNKVLSFQPANCSSV